jgi:ubiquinol-cytochrome c reductase cytochrome c subunit
VRRLALTALAFALWAAAPAAAVPPVGIIRPIGEQGASLQELGAELFAANCSSCHGIRGRGVGLHSPQRGVGGISGMGPDLRGVGAQAVDFYLRTGRMPLSTPTAEPERHDPYFTEREIRALIAYVTSLGNGPPVPTPHPERGSVSAGLHLFTEHCAGCHQIVAQGGIVTGARVPPLQDATPVQIAEAVRVGPYLMPRFPRSQISDRQLDSIIRYVQLTKGPPDRGGWGIGNIGPVPEGMVTWFIAIVALLGTCVAIGTRLKE